MNGVRGQSIVCELSLAKAILIQSESYCEDCNKKLQYGMCVTVEESAIKQETNT